MFGRSQLLAQWFSRLQHLSRGSQARWMHHNRNHNHSYNYNTQQGCNWHNHYSSKFKSFFRDIFFKPRPFLYYSIVPISGFSVGSIIVDPPSVRADFYSNDPPNFNNNNNNNNNDKNKNSSHPRNRRFQRRHARQQFGQDLCTAVRAQKYSQVRELLSQPGADPDARSPHGWAAIHIAVVNNDAKMVSLLLEHGADVNLADMTSPYVGSVRMTQFSDKIHPTAPTQGWTPLHYAVAFFNESLMKLLISRGANPNIRDSRNYTCVDYIDESIPNGSKLIDLIDAEYEQFLEQKEAREREQRLAYPIEDQLKEHIVGQLLPVSSVASAVRRKLNGWHDPDHPLVFLFLGSSGVGKTELAKTLAKVLCRLETSASSGNDEINGLDGLNTNNINNNNNNNKIDLKKKFIRIDMSEFQQKHEVSKFIGSPPGYVGHEQGGQLTSRLKECPDAIVLLDEVEKAHPDVLTIMLQLFDEGRITDGKGETVECKDAIFVMTSNLAQTEIGDEAEALRRDAARQDSTKLEDIGNEDEADSSNSSSKTVIDEAVSLSRAFIEDTVQPILKRHFQRDEFLGRINEILYFLPFHENELKELTERELLKWRRAAKDRHNIDLVWDSTAIDLLRDGYNFRYGARSIQHEVEKRVVNQLARIHEKGMIKSGMCVNVTADLERGLINLEYFENLQEAKKQGVNVSSIEGAMQDGAGNKKSWFW